MLLDGKSETVSDCGEERSGPELTSSESVYSTKEFIGFFVTCMNIELQ